MTVFRRGCHWFLSWARCIPSTTSHPISLRSILISSFHLRLGLPSGISLSCFPIKVPYELTISPMHAACPAHLINIFTVTKFKISTRPARVTLRCVVTGGLTLSHKFTIFLSLPEIQLHIFSGQWWLWFSQFNGVKNRKKERNKWVKTDRQTDRQTEGRDVGGMTKCQTCGINLEIKITEKFPEAGQQLREVRKYRHSGRYRETRCMAGARWVPPRHSSRTRPSDRGGVGRKKIQVEIWVVTRHGFDSLSYAIMLLQLQVLCTVELDKIIVNHQ